MGNDDKGKKTESAAISYSLILLIVCIICVNNYTLDEATVDGIRDYWIYANVRLILSAVLLGVAILSCCGTGCCILCKKDDYAGLFGILLIVTWFVTICVDLGYLFTIVHNHSELAKFHMKKTSEWYGQMLQVLCMIFFVLDCIISGILGCFCLCSPCIYNAAKN